MHQELTVLMVIRLLMLRLLCISAFFTHLLLRRVSFCPKDAPSRGHVSFIVFPRGRLTSASFHSPPLDYILRNHLNDIFFMSVLLPIVTYFFFTPDRLCHSWAGQCVYCHCAVISLGGATVRDLAGCVCLLYFLFEQEEIRRRHV